MCIRSEQGTPAPLWWGEHAGQGKASREAAPVTDSNVVSLGLERCQSSTGLKYKIKARGKKNCASQNTHKPLYMNSDNIT